MAEMKNVTAGQADSLLAEARAAAKAVAALGREKGSKMPDSRILGTLADPQGNIFPQVEACTDAMKRHTELFSDLGLLKEALQGDSQRPGFSMITSAYESLSAMTCQIQAKIHAQSQELFTQIAALDTAIGSLKDALVPVDNFPYGSFYQVQARLAACMEDYAKQEEELTQQMQGLCEQAKGLVGLYEEQEKFAHNLAFVIAHQEHLMQEIVGNCKKGPDARERG